MSRARRSSVICVAVLCLASTAEAQVYMGRDAPRRGMFEASGGGLFTSGFDMGSLTAELTRSTTTDRFDLFTSETEVAGFPGGFVRLGLYLSDSVSIEGGMRYSRPVLSVRLSGDAESGPNVTAEETLSHYLFEGSLVWHLRHLSFASGRAIPYLAGGGGYLRELHEENQLVETGQEYHALGGLKYWFGSRVRRFGLRIEGGVSARKKGFDSADEMRPLPVAFGGLSYLF
jgi:hypothetical protein